MKTEKKGSGQDSIITSGKEDKEQKLLPFNIVLSTEQDLQAFYVMLLFRLNASVYTEMSGNTDIRNENDSLRRIFILLSTAMGRMDGLTVSEKITMGLRDLITNEELIEMANLDEVNNPAKQCAQYLLEERGYRN